MPRDSVHDYRDRFREVPHGVWSTCADAPADQILRFYGNRKGVCHIARRLGGGIIHFEWQPHEECCLRVRRIDPRTGLPKDREEWLFFRYEFHYAETADGDAVAMRMLEFGRLENFPEPLFFHGPATESNEELVEEEPGLKPEPLGEQLHGRMLIALFIAGMVVGLGLVVAGEMQEDVHPLVYVFGGFGLFLFLWYLLSRPPRPKPVPEDEYVREKE